ncbi:peroxisome biogenesis factor 13 [Salmo salar]|uniref:Peroxisomal membrane protein PEX13 n=1 Tax=Salmo salar TaxID=8030 RepID=C0HBE1_SALSA|nr:peroxisome biogenesis factor 13 [Salmo salar]ACN11360.1 Peroxisomal membrane protein PEX13 [Salmo salar]|eukprot:NP_001167323.1 peroxisomal membrane protein PEX13 [Salmo salar]
MASQPPPKPWERRIPGAAMSAPVNYRSTDFAPPGPSTSGLSGPAGPPVLTRMVPPVPPRPVQSIQSYRPSYGSFPGSSYNPYGSSSLYGGAYSPYSGGYGMGGGLGGSLGYSRFGQTGGEDVAPSRFVQQAEESSRGAFQSIESIVQAFTSVSMMMDATFSAVYNSFRAVLDVANHLTRLRMHFTKVLSAFALVRTLRYLYRRIQRMLGLRRDGEVEDLWADSEGAVLATRGAGAAMEDPRAGAVKSWPIFLFLAVVLGGPYLIWKLLSSAQGPEESVTNWASGEDDHVVARAEYDFTAASEEELSLNAGDMLNLAPKEHQPRVRGWLLASVDGQTTGLIPANYVKVLGKRRGRKHAELERLAQVQAQPGNPLGTTLQAPQPNLATGPVPTVAPGLFSGLGPAEAVPVTIPEELLECVYRETPAGYSSLGLGVVSSTPPASSTVLTIPEKIDL